MKNLPLPARGEYVATVFNKHKDALCLVVVSIADSREVRISFPGDNFSLNDGNGYFGGEGGPDSSYQRFHTPSANLGREPFNRKGYGFLLYCGGALSANKEENNEGIYSDSGRSTSAACVWASMLCETHGLKDERSVKCCTDPCEKKPNCEPIAVHHEGEEDEEEIDVPVRDFCIEIPESKKDYETDDGPGYITDDEVCGRVTASVRKHTEGEWFDTLDTSEVLSRSLVVDYAGDLGVSGRVPADIAVRATLRAGSSGADAPSVEALIAIGTMFRRVYGDAAAQEFLSRPEVLISLKEWHSPRYKRLARMQAGRRAAAEKVGQRRITFEGLGQDPLDRLVAQIERNPRPLRPLSSRSKRIIQAFDVEMP